MSEPCKHCGQANECGECCDWFNCQKRQIAALQAENARLAAQWARACAAAGSDAEDDVLYAIRDTGDAVGKLVSLAETNDRLARELEQALADVKKAQLWARDFDAGFVSVCRSMPSDPLPGLNAEAWTLGWRAGNWQILASELEQAQAAGAEMTLAARLSVAERARQIVVEGWTADHDDQWRLHELRDAGVYYSCVGSWPELGDSYERERLWPWDQDWRKVPVLTGQTDRPRCLVKAIALLMAELDRMLRNEWSNHSLATSVPSPGQP